MISNVKRSSIIALKLVHFQIQKLSIIFVKRTSLPRPIASAIIGCYSVKSFPNILLLLPESFCPVSNATNELERERERERERDDKLGRTTTVQKFETFSVLELF